MKPLNRMRGSLNPGFWPLVEPPVDWALSYIDTLREPTGDEADGIYEGCRELHWGEDEEDIDFQKFVLRS